MFQFSGLAAMHLWIQCMLIRESRDQRLFDNYPRLIAVFHARHRLLMPRHPPCALSSLTTNIQNSLPLFWPAEACQTSRIKSDMRGNTTLESCPRLTAGTDSSSSNDSSFDSSRSHRPFDQHEQRFFTKRPCKIHFIAHPEPLRVLSVQIDAPSRRCHLHNNQIVKDHFTTLGR